MSLLSIRNLETYLASGLNLVLNLILIFPQGKKKKVFILEEREFSEELMKDCFECAESQTLQFELIF